MGFNAYDKDPLQVRRDIMPRWAEQNCPTAFREYQSAQNKIEEILREAGVNKQLIKEVQIYTAISWKAGQDSVEEQRRHEPSTNIGIKP